MLPIGVVNARPRRPGDVPNTTLPREYAWPTGVTSLDSPPRMLRTHTRSSRVATCASELNPTKYLKSPTPCLYMPSPRSISPQSRNRVACVATCPDCDVQGGDGDDGVRTSSLAATCSRPPAFIHASAALA